MARHINLRGQNRGAHRSTVVPAIPSSTSPNAFDRRRGCEIPIILHFWRPLQTLSPHTHKSKQAPRKCHVPHNFHIRLQIPKRMSPFHHGPNEIHTTKLEQCNADRFWCTPTNLALIGAPKMALQLRLRLQLIPNKPKQVSIQVSNPVH